MNASSEELGAEDPIVRWSADATAVGMAFVLETRAASHTQKGLARRFVFAGPRCLGVNGVGPEVILALAGLAALSLAPIVVRRLRRPRQ